MPLYIRDRQPHVGYSLTKDSKTAHGIAPNLGVRVESKDGETRMLSRSLCDREVVIRDRNETFDRDKPAPNACKRCVVVARGLDGAFAQTA